LKTLRLIFGDQLSYSISSLEGYDKVNDIVLMCEVIDEANYVKHHKKKIAFLFSAMRHFANELIEMGFSVCYVKLDDILNTGSFLGEVMRHQKHGFYRNIVVTQPSEYRVLVDCQSWQEKLGCDVEIRPDDRFLSSPEDFSNWALGRKQIRMEYFYRIMRQNHNILMAGNEPVGGKWNYDSENRQKPNVDLAIPAPFRSSIDSITQEVITLVSERFADHFGDVLPFQFAVTRDEALKALKQFIEYRLFYFGDYQDAMIEGEPWMYHSHLSFYLNCGLLLPMECIRAAEQAYYDGNAPLNSVEGFIRQIVGWREYIRGIYWLKMPAYKAENFFEAKRKLPDFYWTADTKMNCLSQCVTETKENAYAHHIQRLMVLGNFALLTGIDPVDVNEWFLIVYADAYEWVELPNVTGMILFADGGYLASKPYAAGGSYINKMSNFCKNCDYSVTKKNGENACPFNYLYWSFLAQNRDKLSNNYRLAMMYKVLDRMSDDKKEAIEHDSQLFLASLT
jgi:deoxyribodipyrimidine photolyase-related protein